MARKVIEQQYIYKAEVDRVVDGDTVDVLLDLSFGVYRKVRIRANGIDTPESRTRNKAEKVLGLAAKKRMKVLCGKEIYVESLNGGKLDKYGRLLADMYTHGSRRDICKILSRRGMQSSTMVVRRSMSGRDDDINPSHYRSGSIECIDSIKASMSKRHSMVTSRALS